MEMLAKLQDIRKNIARILVGRQDTIDLLMITLLCQGHVLIEDVPGVGKTRAKEVQLQAYLHR